MKSVSVSSNVSSIQFMEDDDFDSALKNYKSKLVLKNKQEIELFAKRLLARGQEEDLQKLKTAWTHFSHKWALDAVIRGVVSSETSDEQLVLGILEDLKRVALREEPDVEQFLAKREDPSRSLFSLDSGNSFGVPEACQRGWLRVLRCLLGDFRADVDEEDREGCTGLQRAVQSRSLPVVRSLVEEFGADVHRLNRSQETYLFAAVEAGGYDVCKYLIERGVDRDRANAQGLTAAKLVKKSDASILALFIRPEPESPRNKPPAVLVSDLRSRSSSACDFESGKSLSPVKLGSYFKDPDAAVRGLSKKTGVSALARTAAPKDPASAAPGQPKKLPGHRQKHSRGHRTLYYLLYTDEKKMQPTVITKPYFRAFELRFPLVASLLTDSSQSITEARAAQLLAELKAPRIELLPAPKPRPPPKASPQPGPAWAPGPAEGAGALDGERQAAEEPAAAAEPEEPGPAVTIVHDFSFAKNMQVMAALKRHRYAYVLAKPWFVLGVTDCINDLSLLGISDKLSLNCYACNHEWIDDLDKMIADALAYCGAFCDVGKAVLKLRAEWNKQLQAHGVQRCGPPKEKIRPDSPAPAHHRPPASSTSRKAPTHPHALLASPRPPASPGRQAHTPQPRDVPQTASLTKKTAQKTIIKPNNRQAFKEDLARLSPIRQVPITSYFRTSILHMIAQDKPPAGPPPQTPAETGQSPAEIEVSDDSEDFAQAERLENEARPLSEDYKLPN